MWKESVDCSRSVDRANDGWILFCLLVVAKLAKLGSIYVLDMQSNRHHGKENGPGCLWHKALYFIRPFISSKIDEHGWTVLILNRRSSIAERMSASKHVYSPMKILYQKVHMCYICQYIHRYIYFPCFTNKDYNKRKCTSNVTTRTCQRCDTSGTQLYELVQRRQL